jgi:nitrilase
MKVFAAVQMTSGPDVLANIEIAGPLMVSAVQQGASVVLLPENFNFIGRRDADKRDVAEAFGVGPTQDFLAGFAQRHGVTVIGGTQPLRSESDDGRVTNSMLVYGADGRCIARYDKIHLFDVDVPGKPGETYRESSHVAPGSQVMTVDTPAGRVGLSVCYDMRFPELYRRLVTAGAEILVMPAAFTVPTGRAHWETLLRARAIENLSYVFAAAQSGIHPNGRETYGDTMAIDPWGRVLQRLPRGNGVVTAAVDLDELRRIRAEFPALTNRVLGA